MTIHDIDVFADHIEQLARVPAIVAEKASPVIAGLIQAEFDAGRSPYGETWAALRPSTVKRGRRPPPLTDTRAMRDSTKVAPGGAGIVGSINSKPAVFHQYGTSKMAARQIFPEAELVPTAWCEELDKATEAAVLEVLK
jgi:hypothetical protein